MRRLLALPMLAAAMLLIVSCATTAPAPTATSAPAPTAVKPTAAAVPTSAPAAASPAATAAPAATAPATAAPAGTAAAGGQYIIGYTSDLTGPLQPSHGAPPIAFKAYIDDLNKRGGINGQKVNLMLDDNKGDATKAATDAQRYVDAKANLVFVSSSSATHQAILPKIQESGIPMITFVAMEVSMPPTPNPAVFGHRQGAAKIQGGALSWAMLSNKSKVQGTMKVKGISVDIPGSRADTQNAVDRVKATGVEADMEVVPITLSDTRPLATKIVQGGYNVLTMAAPGPTQESLITALKSLGWQGVVVVTGGRDDITFLNGLKNESVVVVGDVNEPAFQTSAEYKQFATSANISATDAQLASGWLDGKMVEDILKRAGWPVTNQKVLDVMNNFQFDRKPYMGPVQWTKTDHHGPTVWWALRWNKDKGVVAEAAAKIDPNSGEATPQTP